MSSMVHLHGEHVLSGGLMAPRGEYGAGCAKRPSSQAAASEMANRTLAVR